jgi:glycosyltransferase involved in cell wall biosynthesis
MTNHKIALFTFNLAGGGAETFTVRLAKSLSEKGCPVNIVLMKREGVLLKKVPESVNVIDLNAKLPLGLKTGSGFLAVLKLANYIQKHSPDVILSVMNYPNIIAIIARMFTKKKITLIISEHSTMSQEAHYGTLLMKIVSFLARPLYPKADAIVAVSKGVAEDLSHITGIPKERICVIYNPTDPEIEAKAQEPVDHPWFKNSKIPVILCVARLDPQKDLPTLIRAFSIVRKERPARLAILGEGSERAKLEALVKELGLDGDVWMPGFVDNPFKFMAKASVFVLSSAREALPTVLIEALACGCPVVSTDCPSGPAEILEGGKWGNLVPVGDYEKLAEAILETIENPPDREKLKERGRDFSLDRIGQQYLQLITELLEKRPNM